MKKYLSLISFLIISQIVCAQQKNTYPTPDIPFKKYTLANGLTLIVSEDHKVPMAACNIWYHVGSKNEKPGKTGFAHLFEHIMFTGSEHYQDFDKVMQTVGGGSNNGSTTTDRTNFYETFTPSGLDRVLFVESDRMGHLLNGLDSAKIEVQRGVVQNEKRQDENRPYALIEELTQKNTYPPNHPYSWPIIGSMEDLNAATEHDIKDWFRQYYGPNNAVLVICGDVVAEEVFHKVQKYFGEIPASNPITRQGKWIAKMTGTHMVLAQDRVAQPLLQKTWNVPEWGNTQATYLDLLSNVLTNGASSRLYKRLITQEHLCTEVYSYTNKNEIGQQFTIGALVNEEKNIDRVNQIVDEELTKIFSEGVTERELHLSKINLFSAFISSMERIGGEGKSEILAMNEVFGGSPDFYKTTHNDIRNAGVADLKKAANDWLKDGEFILKILPYPAYQNSENIDRSEMPALAPISPMKFPEIKTIQLKNGVQVYLVERHETPLVTMDVLFDAGFEKDDVAKAGTMKLMTDLLLKGTETKTAGQINDNINELGARLLASSNLDQTYIQLLALKDNIDASVQLLSDVMLHANFPESEFDRLKKDQIKSIDQESTDPLLLTSRILPQLLFDKTDSRSLPSSGTGFKETVNTITREDVIKAYRTISAYKNARVFVVGDITENELKPILEKYLVHWPAGDIVSKSAYAHRKPSPMKLYFMDMPDAIQSVICAAQLFPVEKDLKKHVANQMMNTLLGGSFLSRLNMNLREDKHWSYGATSNFSTTKQHVKHALYTSVQTDKTKESLLEILKELTEVHNKRPFSEKEFKQQQNATLLALPEEYESNSDVCNKVEDAVFYNRGLQYVHQISNIIQQLSLSDIQTAAKTYIKPEQLTWLVIGDKKTVYQDLKDLKWGEVIELDTNGNRVK